MREELARAYLEHSGFKVVKGDIESDQLFLPFMILDVVYSIYQTSIHPIKARFEMNRAKKEMLRSYNHFNQHFFRSFDQNQTSEIVDAMDGFEDYIHNDLVLTKCKIMDKIKFLEFDVQMLMSDILLANMLSRAAGLIYYETYQGLPERYRDNADIRNITNNACIFGNLYYQSIGGTRKITVNDASDIDEQIQRLLNKICSWIKRDHTQS